MNESIKLYSKRAVLLATFLGGPLGGCILMRRNSLNLGRNREGNIILFIGILVMILLGATGFLEIGETFDRFLRVLLPALSVAIGSVCVEKLHGKELIQHKQEGRPLYSMWRAAGTGAVILVAALSMMMYGRYLEKTSFDVEIFIQNEAEFIQNQEVVDQINDFDISQGNLDDFINQTALPKLNRNIELCKNMLANETLPKEFRSHVELFQQLTLLQIEKCHLINKEITTGENVQRELINVLEKIDEIVAKLNAESE